MERLRGQSLQVRGFGHRDQNRKEFSEVRNLGRQVKTTQVSGDTSDPPSSVS